MKNRSRVKAMIAVVMTALFLMACDGQIDEVNKLIAEANKKTTEAGALLDKANKESDEILSTDFTDLKEMRTKNEAKIKQAMADFDKCTELINAAAKDFSDASKLKISDKLREYTDLNSKQTAKLGELTNALRTSVKDYVEAADVDALTKRVDESKIKIDAITKESDELSAKIKKFEADNKDLFSSAP